MWAGALHTAPVTVFVLAGDLHTHVDLAGLCFLLPVARTVFARQPHVVHAVAGFCKGSTRAHISMVRGSGLGAAWVLDAAAHPSLAKTTKCTATGLLKLKHHQESRTVLG